MPPYNQETLDALLSKEVRLPIDLAQHAEPPQTSPYAPLFELQKNGLKFTLRSLFHAIGCKTARLSMREQEEAVHSAYPFYEGSGFEAKRHWNQQGPSRVRL